MSQATIILKLAALYIFDGQYVYILSYAKRTRIGCHRATTMRPIVKRWTHVIASQCETKEGSHVCLHYCCINIDYYTSREDTLILLDESHVSKLLATCASAGSLTAVTIRRISTRCQGDDVLAPVVKVPFHDSLYC